MAVAMSRVPVFRGLPLRSGDYEQGPPEAYFDEAGKWNDSDFVCLCGYVSADYSWHELARRWVERLKHHGLRVVHASSFAEDCRRVGKYDQRDEIFDEFINIIRDHVIVGFVIAISVRDLKALPSHMRKMYGDPHVFCVHRLLRQLHDRLVEDDTAVCVTFDDSD